MPKNVPSDSFCVGVCGPEFQSHESDSDDLDREDSECLNSIDDLDLETQSLEKAS